jgi:hypothetical protein
VTLRASERERATRLRALRFGGPGAGGAEWASDPAERSERGGVPATPAFKRSAARGAGLPARERVGEGGRAKPAARE